jgi:hypothetical protein
MHLAAVVLVVGTVVQSRMSRFSRRGSQSSGRAAWVLLLSACLFVSNDGCRGEMPDI